MKKNPVKTMGYDGGGASLGVSQEVWEYDHVAIGDFPILSAAV